MTDERARMVSLLNHLLQGRESDAEINNELAEHEASNDALVLRACHAARHFLADRDLHETDQAYRDVQIRQLKATIVDLQHSSH